MVQLSLVSGGITTNIDVDEEIKVSDFKKIVEEKLPESKKIEVEKQVLYLNAKKLEDDKKLSDYIDSSKKDNLRVIVLKKLDPKPKVSVSQSNSQVNIPMNPGNNSQMGSPSQNPYAYAQPPQYNPYMTPQQHYNPYMAPQYGHPAPPHFMPPQGGQPMYGGMPGGMPPIQKEHIDLIMNNPNMMDSIIELQSPGISQEEKERLKKVYMDTFKMLQNNPSLLNTLTQSQQGYQSPYMPPQNMYNPYPYPPMSPSMAQPEPVLSREEYRLKYKNELNTLKEMGFVDEEKNLTVLMQSRGDLNVALDMLSRGH